MAEILNQIDQSSIPYPHKHLLQIEVVHDLEYLHRPDEATLTKDDLSALEELHSTWLFRTLHNFGSNKRIAETLISIVPLLTVAVSISKGGKMIDFIRDGGIGMLGILAVGAFLLLRELTNVFRLLVVKDHSRRNLKIDTPSVLLGCLALAFLGVGASVLGLYVSVNAALAADAPNQILLEGFKESLTPLILSAMLATLVILAHYTTRRVMLSWSAPIAE